MPQKHGTLITTETFFVTGRQELKKFYAIEYQKLQ